MLIPKKVKVNHWRLRTLRFLRQSQFVSDKKIGETYRSDFDIRCCAVTTFVALGVGGRPH